MPNSPDLAQLHLICRHWTFRSNACSVRPRPPPPLRSGGLGTVHDDAAAFPPLRMHVLRSGDVRVPEPREPYVDRSPGPAEQAREQACLEENHDEHEWNANQYHGQGKRPLVGIHIKLGHAPYGLQHNLLGRIPLVIALNRTGCTYRDESQGQEDHTDHGESPDVVSTIDGSPALFNRATAEKLFSQVLNLFSCSLVHLPHVVQIVDNLLQLATKEGHLGSVGVTLLAVGGRVRPEIRVAARPEIFSKGVLVGCNHRFDTSVDDGKSVVGPEVPANIRKVLIFKEKLVSKASVEHKVRLNIQSVNITT